MKSLKRLPYTLIISIFLILIIAFCISGTVLSQSSHESKIEEKYYREMENLYVQEIRDLLTDRGYENSGITMTHVIDENGMRTYTVTIHHGRIDRLSETEREELLAQCSEITFPDDGCGFRYEFLKG